MNASRIVLLVGACCAAASLAVMSTARAAVAPADRYAEFVQKFQAAVSTGQSLDAVRVVKAFPDEAALYAENLALQLAPAANEVLEREFAMLTKSWKEAFTKSTFVDKRLAYHQELAADMPRRNERQKLLREYDSTRKDYEANLAGAKEDVVFNGAGESFLGLSKGFEKLGDWLFAARAAVYAALCYDTAARGKGADLRKACEAFGIAVACFDKIEFNIYYYEQTKARHDALVKDGFAEALPDPNAPPPVAPSSSKTAQPLVAKTAFELIKGPDDFLRPSFFNDEVYQIWPVVPLGSKGSTGQFMALDKGPKFVRTDAAKIGLDFGGDGTVEKPLPLTGNFVTVDFDLGEGEALRKFAFVFKTGIQDDFFQGLKINLQPSDEQVQVYCMNAGSVVGQVNGINVRVIDDNMDGVYGSDPRGWLYPGLSEQIQQPDLDSIVVGDSKRARPWSKYQEIGGAWYELAAENGGATLKATPLDVQTGTLKLDFKGPLPNWLVVRGTGNIEKCYFDLVNEAKKPVSVPAGVYEVCCGEIRAGKKQQVAKCMILAGPNTKKFTVTAGAETVVKLGGPFNIEFTAEKGEEQVKVKGKSVTVVGCSFERYERMWNCSLRPEISWRKAGTKKGSKPERMVVIQDLYEQDEKGAFKWNTSDTWRPADSVVAIKKGDSVEVQLVEKKNRLLGELESDWR